jgi:hypothetical protein
MKRKQKVWHEKQNRILSDKMVRSIHEVANFTTIPILYNVLIAGKLKKSGKPMVPEVLYNTTFTVLSNVGPVKLQY